MKKKQKQLKGDELYDKEKFLSTYEGADRVVKSAELLEEMQKGMEKVPRFDTGIPSLDRILGGVEAGELIVVTGLTGEGKTTALMSITKNIATAGERALWFTFEVTPRQFLDKLQITDGKLPDFLIPRSSMDMAEDDYVHGWEKRNGRTYETMDWVEDRIMEAKVKYDTEEKPLRAVFIDHVHMLFAIDNIGRNVSLEIGDLVARIKYWAISKGLVIFLIAHCRDVTTEMSAREPRMGDIRDSGMISRYADTVLGVWRIRNDNDGSKNKRESIREDDTKAKIAIFKNRRRGKLGYFTGYVKDHYLSEEIDFGGV